MTYLLLVVGFLILIKGADLLVEGAVSLAKRFHISDMVIGLTIVAFGTSAPELVVNVMASAQGKADLAIANVLGSNLANTLAALGVASLFGALTIKKATLFKEIPLCFLAVVAVGLLANDRLFSSGPVSFLSRADGLILLCFFVLFFSYVVSLSQRKEDFLHEEEQMTMKPWPLSGLFVILGLTGLTLGGQWVVNGAVSIALSLGLSETLVGLTVVAIGTSLPEIVTSARFGSQGQERHCYCQCRRLKLIQYFLGLGCERHHQTIAI